jgi:Ca2+-binding RTX toxin-like protein
MMLRKFTRLVGVLLITVIFASVFNAAAAGISVPPLRFDEQRFAITISDLAPPQCSSMTFSNIETGSGLIFGTGGNDLILGSGNTDWIFALGGNDCIMSGGGDDAIFAGAGTDTCIGGPGDDTLNACEPPLYP